MTKKIKDFGAPIGGGRKKKNVAALEQENKAVQYFEADKIGEEPGTYGIQEKQTKKPCRRKRPIQIPKLASVCRTGPEYLPGGRHANEDDFKDLGIRGVEFGACLSDEEAQSSLDDCYLAFCDLARILKIDKKDVSLGGTLALAFGARGYGGSGPATYNPKYQVINFTRGCGAGSLAREWAHAFDYYMGRACGLGGTGSSIPVSGDYWREGVPPSVKELFRSMSFRREKLTPEEQSRIMEEQHDNRIKREEEQCGEILRLVTPQNLTEEQQSAWNQAVREVYDTRRFAELNMYVWRNYPNKAIEELSRVHKEITGHVIPKKKKWRLNYSFAFLAIAERKPMGELETEWRDEDTEFYRNAREMNMRYARTVHGRHSDNCEQMARAFECYVADKLKEEGNQSQYLTAHSEDVIFVRENGENVYGGPMGEERKEINRRFDAMFGELKEMGILHHQSLSKDMEAVKNKEKLETAKTSMAYVKEVIIAQTWKSESGLNKKLLKGDKPNRINGARKL